jgi:TusA-related sulfurtransferase
MSKGDVMELVSDNPTTVETIPALAMALSSRHLVTLHTDTGWRIYLRKED